MVRAIHVSVFYNKCPARKSISGSERDTHTIVLHYFIPYIGPGPAYVD